MLTVIVRLALLWGLLISLPSAYALSALDIVKQQQASTLSTNTISTPPPQTLHTPPKTQVASVMSQPRPDNHASKYALIYIFSSECPYCHQFTPTLNAFLSQHPNLQRYAFSIDGKGLSGFEHPMPATKGVIDHFFHSQHFVYPATFFVNTDTNKFTGLTYQNVPLSTLEQRYEQLVTSPEMLQALN